MSDDLKRRLRANQRSIYRAGLTSSAYYSGWRIPWMLFGGDWSTKVPLRAYLGKIARK